LGAQAIISIAYINYFCRAFDVNRSLIAVHLPLVIGLLALSFFLPGLALRSRRVRGRRWTKYVLILPPAVVTSALLVLYLADFASNVWMGTNVTHKLAALWALNWRRGGQLLSLSTGIYAARLGILATLAGTDVALSET